MKLRRTRPPQTLASQEKTLPQTRAVGTVGRLAHVLCQTDKQAAKKHTVLPSWLGHVLAEKSSTSDPRELHTTTLTSLHGRRGRSRIRRLAALVQLIHPLQCRRRAPLHEKAPPLSCCVNGSDRSHAASSTWSLPLLAAVHQQERETRPTELSCTWSPQRVSPNPHRKTGSNERHVPRSKQRGELDSLSGKFGSLCASLHSRKVLAFTHLVKRLQQRKDLGVLRVRKIASVLQTCGTGATTNSRLSLQRAQTMLPDNVEAASPRQKQWICTMPCRAPLNREKPPHTKYLLSSSPAC